MAAPAKAGKAVPAAKGPATPSAVPAVDASGIQRSAKPSSRLAQITVPSMAQAVASNAAKASYLPSMTPVSVAPVAPAAIKRDPKLANNWKTKTPEQLSDAEVLAIHKGELSMGRQIDDIELAVPNESLTAVITAIASAGYVSVVSES